MFSGVMHHNQETVGLKDIYVIRMASPKETLKRSLSHASMTTSCGKELERELAKHPKVNLFKVNEYNTTKMCSKCVTKEKLLFPLTISKSPHRYG